MGWSIWMKTIWTRWGSLKLCRWSCLCWWSSWLAITVIERGSNLGWETSTMPWRRDSRPQLLWPTVLDLELYQLCNLKILGRELCRCKPDLLRLRNTPLNQLRHSWAFGSNVASCWAIIDRNLKNGIWNRTWNGHELEMAHFSEHFIIFCSDSRKHMLSSGSESFSDLIDLFLMIKNTPFLISR